MENYSGYKIDHTPVSGFSRSLHYRVNKDRYLRLAYAMERTAKREKRRGDDKKYTTFLRLLATASEYRRLEGLFE